MKQALNNLNEKQIAFICDECNITRDELFDMDEDTLYDNVYDVMCDIEIAETPSSKEKLSERCQIASEIVTELGNALAIEMGVFDESHED